MNRFLVTKGSLVGGVIVYGSTGESTAYNAAGERATDTMSNGSGGTQVEFYGYSEDGYLETVSIGATSSGPPPTSGTLAVQNYRDALGRVTQYYEYTSTGTTVEYSRNDVYNADSQVTTETDYTLQSSGMQSKYGDRSNKPPFLTPGDYSNLA